MEVTNGSCMWVDLHARGYTCVWLWLCTAATGTRKKGFLATRWRRLGSDGYGNGDRKRPDGAEMHTHKWLLTGCSLTSRVKSAVTVCLYFLGNTLQCVFRIAMHGANSGSLKMRVVYEKFTRHLDWHQRRCKHIKRWWDTKTAYTAAAKYLIDGGQPSWQCAIIFLKCSIRLWEPNPFLICHGGNLCIVIALHRSSQWFCDSWQQKPLKSKQRH